MISAIHSYNLAGLTQQYTCLKHLCMTVLGLMQFGLVEEGPALLHVTLSKVDSRSLLLILISDDYLVPNEMLEHMQIRE